MSRQVSFCLVSLLFLLSPTIKAFAKNPPPQALAVLPKVGDYKTYVNARFRFSVLYPAGSLKPVGQADNGDGQQFVSTDGSMHCSASGANAVVNSDLGEELVFDLSRPETKPLKAKDITYKVTKKNFFVVSWRRGGQIYYIKTVMLGDVFKTLYFAYDVEQKSKWDPVIAKMVASFQTNLPADSKEN